MDINWTGFRLLNNFGLISERFLPRLHAQKNEPNNYLEHIFLRWIKVSKFQNEFMKSSLLPKAQYRAEILTIFGSYFGRNDDFVDSF